MALALLWCALVFSRRIRFRPAYLALVLFPPVWSAFAIYHFTDQDQFLFAALPAVAFLSGATLWTAVVFFRFRGRTGSRGALLLGVAFLLWGLHHLDYPILRARGAWNPWGYYLDIVFTLAVGAGMLIVVLEDVQRGLGAMAILSAELQRGGPGEDVAGALLAGAMNLPGVRGTALHDRAGGRITRALGALASWEGHAPPDAVVPLIAEAQRADEPRSLSGWEFPYAVALPLTARSGHRGTMLIVGDIRDPFTALDQPFLRALGQQVGGALENADLYRNLQRRTADLERLSGRMVAQHEDERRRLSLELHDETAQVFSAVKLQLGIAREEVPPPQAERLARVMELVDEGMASIRSVTEALRPSLLDDLGLSPALRALVTAFEARTGVSASLSAPEALPPMPEAAELAVFRAVQEGLSNVARHADATRVGVRIAVAERHLSIHIEDDGAGPEAAVDRTGERMGLAGMRERLSSLGGDVRLSEGPGGGARLTLDLPLGDHG